MYAVLLKPSRATATSFIEHAVEMFTKIGGSGYEPDVEDLREIATLSYDRGHDARGSQRQLWAIVADRDRAPELRELKVPATVIHGAEDKLVRPSRRPRDGEARSRARGWSRSPAWATACRAAPGRRSSARSPTPPPAPARRSLPQHQDEHDDQDQQQQDTPPVIAEPFHWRAQ